LKRFYKEEFMNKTHKQGSRVVVIGAGLGGLPVAYELKHHLGAQHQITLLSESPKFTFIPGLIQVGLGHIPLEHIQLDVATLSRRHGLEWLQGQAELINPEQRLVMTKDGQQINYDYLVIASGAELATDLVPGLSEYAHSVCNPRHALAARTAWEEFLKNPTDLIVGAAPGAGCFGPAYEFLLLADWELRQRGLRDQVKITYITPEPYIGHLGIAKVHRAQELSEELMRFRGIETITNAAIAGLTPNTVYLRDGRAFASGYSMILPAFRGAKFVQASGLGNEKGFLPILPTQRHRDDDRIYGVGVSVQLEQPDKTPVPIGMPKSGQMVEAMAMVAAHNIAVELGIIHKPLETPTLEAICFAEFGNTGIAYIAAPVVADPLTGKRRYSYAAQGKWVNWAKIAFEQYFLWKMRLGLGVPWFEKLGLKLLLGLKLSSPVLEPQTLPPPIPVNHS